MIYFIHRVKITTKDGRKRTVKITEATEGTQIKARGCPLETYLGYPLTVAVEHYIEKHKVRG